MPLRLEIGPKDIEKSQVVLARRDTREKAGVPMDGLATHVRDLLDAIQRNLFERAAGVPRRSHAARGDLRRVQAGDGRPPGLRHRRLVRLGGLRGPDQDRHAGDDPQHAARSRRRRPGRASAATSQRSPRPGSRRRIEASGHVGRSGFGLQASCAGPELPDGSRASASRFSSRPRDVASSLRARRWPGRPRRDDDATSRCGRCRSGAVSTLARTRQPAAPDTRRRPPSSAPREIRPVAARSPRRATRADRRSPSRLPRVASATCAAARVRPSTHVGWRSWPAARAPGCVRSADEVGAG